MDFSNIESVEIQISEDGQRVWVSVDGECQLRVKGTFFIEIQDDRKDKDED